MKPAFHVSICGGGIGGLMLALVISKYGGPSVEVFEAGPTLTTIGAGVSFFGRTMDIMKDLGLYDELLKIAVGPPQENTGPNFRKSDQSDGYYWFSIPLKRGLLSVHRKDLIAFLVRHVPPACKIHTSKRLEFYDVDFNTGEIMLHFSDGSTFVTDVLVGADGIWSATRKTMYQKLASSTRGDDCRKILLKCVDPIWTGTMAYRNIVPTAKLMHEYPDVEVATDLMLHLGKKKHVVTYPISQGQFINVGIFCFDREAFESPFEGRWVTDVSENEIVDQFEDWDVCARAIVKCIERPSRWAIHALRPLPHYVDGRVVLLGDAAHAMQPYLGAGAGLAMEDAFVLGRLLTHELTHRENIDDALKMYEEVRLPFANSIVQRAQDVGRYYTFCHDVSTDESGPAHNSEGDLEYMRGAIEDAWEWQSEPDWVWGDAEERWRKKCGTPTEL